MPYKKYRSIPKRASPDEAEEILNIDKKNEIKRSKSEIQ
jgi:hypothetical protein